MRRIRKIIRVPSISFQTFLIQAFKIVIDSWKFTILLLYILWDDWPIFRISGSNEHLQQELEYTLLKPDCHSWGISKMQSGREDTLEERYEIKFCFKLGRNATEMYGMLQTAFGPRDRVPSGSMLAIPDPRRPDSKSTHKLLMIPFFDSTGMIYMHWVPTRQTVNKEYYVEVLR